MTKVDQLKLGTLTLYEGLDTPVLPYGNVIAALSGKEPPVRDHLMTLGEIIAVNKSLSAPVAELGRPVSHIWLNAYRDFSELTSSLRPFGEDEFGIHRTKDERHQLLMGALDASASFLFAAEIGSRSPSAFVAYDRDLSIGREARLNITVLDSGTTGAPYQQEALVAAFFFQTLVDVETIIASLCAADIDKPLRASLSCSHEGYSRAFQLAIGTSIRNGIWRAPTLAEKASRIVASLKSSFAGRAA